MKVIIASALTAALLLPATAKASSPARGEKTFGLKTGYVTTNNSVSAGLKFSYAFSRIAILAPSVDYVFRNNDRDAVLINLDLQSAWFAPQTSKWRVYSILGINYSSWSDHDYYVPMGEVTTRHGRLGLNAGAGTSVDVTPSLRLCLEGKYNCVTHNSTGIFNLGISYVF